MHYASSETLCWRNQTATLMSEIKLQQNLPSRVSLYLFTRLTKDNTYVSLLYWYVVNHASLNYLTGALKTDQHLSDDHAELDNTIELSAHVCVTCLRAEPDQQNSKYR